MDRDAAAPGAKNAAQVKSQNLNGKCKTKLWEPAVLQMPVKVPLTVQCQFAP
jgi:hypothetical protein